MAPTLRPDRAWGRRCGGVLVAGVDEAGRGPLAGPVVAAAVIFPANARTLRGLDDSKKLSAKKRAGLEKWVRRAALTHGVGIATAQEIDVINILEATRLAARRALAQLDPVPGALITDALSFPAELRPVLAIEKGDGFSSSIAAASILAKETRDRLMDHYAQEFPGYGWEYNRGYPTPDHHAAIEQLGPTTLHRMTFAGVGFFDEELRWSRTGAALRERFRSGKDVLAEFQSARGSLPPLEVTELEALLGAVRAAD